MGSGSPQREGQSGKGQPGEGEGEGLSAGVSGRVPVPHSALDLVNWQEPHPGVWGR